MTEIFNVDEQTCWICPENPMHTEACLRNYESLRQQHGRPVVRYDPDGKNPQPFNTVQDAATHHRILRSNICRALKSFSYTAGGYRWKLKSEVDDQKEQNT